MGMKIKLSELRKVVKEVLAEMHDDSPMTQRSPDTTRTFHPDTLEMMADSEPETELPPGTLASPGVQAADDLDDTSLESFLDDMDNQQAPTLSMRGLGLGRQEPESAAETTPMTVRSPR
jgi:hypothetical protein